MNTGKDVNMLRKIFRKKTAVKDVTPKVDPVLYWRYERARKAYKENIRMYDEITNDDYRDTMYDMIQAGKAEINELIKMIKISLEIPIHGTLN